MAVSLSKLFRATRMSRKGRWADAARLVQQALGIAPARKTARPTGVRKDPRLHPLHPLQPVAPLRTARAQPATVPAKNRGPAFTSHTFTFAGERHSYRLFVPRKEPSAPPQPMPLLVMLHGCKQDAADFARGTAMNALAQDHGCLVLYPEQRTKANGLRCWNWFEPRHQLRGAGEPAMLAALVQRVVTRQRADATRVYVGGLSAGAAMAALLTSLYPELFAAAGLHSGLPAGAARNVVSAFRVMRSGGAAGSATPGPGVPTFVIHGTDDKTVNPDNGENAVKTALAGFEKAGVALEEERFEHPAPGSRATTRTLFRDANGTAQVEHWRVEGGPHAWSGGHAEGSYTDPEGPDASAAMLAFWLQHHK